MHSQNILNWYLLLCT